MGIMSTAQRKSAGMDPIGKMERKRRAALFVELDVGRISSKLSLGKPTSANARTIIKERLDVPLVELCPLTLLGAVSVGSIQHSNTRTISQGIEHFGLGSCDVLLRA